VINEFARRKQALKKHEQEEATRPAHAQTQNEQATNVIPSAESVKPGEALR
jgi:hypothetical protein